MLKEFRKEVRNALLNLDMDYEVRKIKDKGSMEYTDELTLAFHYDGHDAYVNITIAPTFVCVHNDLLRDFLSKEDVLRLNENLPQMYEVQKRRCNAKIAKYEAEIARLKELMGEQQETETETETEQTTDNECPF